MMNEGGSLWFPVARNVAKWKRNMVSVVCMLEYRLQGTMAGWTSYWSQKPLSFQKVNLYHLTNYNLLNSARRFHPQKSEELGDELEELDISELWTVYEKLSSRTIPSAAERCDSKILIFSSKR